MYIEFGFLKYLPIRSLTLAKKRLDGRNLLGKKTRLYRGGGTKKRVRLLDFRGLFWFLPFVVLRYEYDPLRSAFVALICYLNGVLSYFLASVFLESGTVLDPDIYFFRYGGVFKLGEVPLGFFVFGLENHIGSSGQSFTVLRSAGVGGQVLKKQGNFVLVRLPSKEERVYDGGLLCSLGFVSNTQVKFRCFSRAGQRRWRGYRPRVRGVAKNPVDHPHGGGEGRTSGGRPSVNKKGVYTKGVRTARMGRGAFNYIIKHRRIFC